MSFLSYNKQSILPFYRTKHYFCFNSKQTKHRMKVLQLLGFMFLSGSLLAQQPYFEVGLMGGVANYYGDMTHDYVVPKESHPAYGGFIKYNLDPKKGFKFNVYSGTVSAADKNSDRANLKARNLSFTSNVTEVAFTFEYNFLGYRPVEFKQRISPYAYAGLAGFHFNPQAYYEGEWYDLQPLGTEGQGMEIFPFRERYRLYEFAIPFGVGFKFAMTERWNIGVEYGARWTFTDYLDDVSRTYVDRNLLIEANGIDAYNLSNRSGEFLVGEPFDYQNNDWRGDPTDNDWYMWLGITLSRNMIKGVEEGFRTSTKDILGCPKPRHINKVKKQR
jgi:opacity protein-like surface antigen